MDATAALFSVSLLLLIGIYGIYWLESRRQADVSAETVEGHSPQDPAA